MSNVQKSNSQPPKGNMTTLGNDFKELIEKVLITQKNIPILYVYEHLLRKSHNLETVVDALHHFDSMNLGVSFLSLGVKIKKIDTSSFFKVIHEVMVDEWSNEVCKHTHLLNAWQQLQVVNKFMKIKERSLKLEINQGDLTTMDQLIDKFKKIYNIFLDNYLKDNYRVSIKSFGRGIRYTWLWDKHVLTVKGSLTHTYNINQDGVLEIELKGKKRIIELIHAFILMTIHQKVDLSNINKVKAAYSSLKFKYAFLRFNKYAELKNRYAQLNDSEFHSFIKAMDILNIEVK